MTRRAKARKGDGIDRHDDDPAVRHDRDPPPESCTFLRIPILQRVVGGREKPVDRDLSSGVQLMEDSVRFCLLWGLSNRTGGTVRLRSWQLVIALRIHVTSK
mmetsp:Transcript_8736/g.21319  ORF Transcript_8736/g.21319 Transcript_8736/m.21319 type:complete len:102 (+) Transcript_8736:575-880(+)